MSTERITALELAAGDRVQVTRRHAHQRVVSVACHDASRTVDVVFESGRRGTFQYSAELTIETP